MATAMKSYVVYRNFQYVGRTMRERCNANIRLCIVPSKISSSWHPELPPEKKSHSNSHPQALSAYQKLDRLDPVLFLNLSSSGKNYLP
eukprot:346149-Amorphochlora_amoeboformis.AAC.1